MKRSVWCCCQRKNDLHITQSVTENLLIWGNTSIISLPLFILSASRPKAKQVFHSGVRVYGSSQQQIWESWAKSYQNYFIITVVFPEKKKGIPPGAPRRSLKYLWIEVSCPMTQARVVTIKWCHCTLMNGIFALMSSVDLSYYCTVLSISECWF